MKGGRKNVRFQRKTGHVSETVRDKANVTINHQQEVAYARSVKMKIIDLGLPWKSLTSCTVSYSSDSTAFCILQCRNFYKG